MRPQGGAARGQKRLAGRLSALSAAALILATVIIAFASHAAPVSITVPYSSVPVADADLDGNPATGAWGDALSATIPLENGAASPYGSATLYAKHDGTFAYYRIDGKVDVPWTSAAGSRFWLGIQISSSGSSHHGGGSWDGIFFGLWDGTDYTPQPTYPPLAIDTNGFGKPPSKDASQDATGKLGYSGSAAPYDFTAEWKKKLNTGDASDIAHLADGTTTYNFYVTTDSDGKGSSGGGIDHSGVTNTNTMKFAIPSGPNAPPQVDLTTPNGGEVWTGGSSHAIRWNMSDAETATTALKVWLNYSTDGGGSYAPIPGAQGLTGLSNPCSYLWTVPTVTTSQARVRATVADAQGGSAADSSLANFAIDATAPSVSGFSPPDGATGVSTSTQVRVSFSEAMNQNSAQQAFSLQRLDTGLYVSGSVAWSANDLVFTPAASLAGGVVYRAQVNASARDVSDPGNQLGAVASASFTTADLTPPSISAVAASPSPQEAGGLVNISAQVTDNGMVGEVWVEVREPGGALLGNSTAGYDPASGHYFLEAPYAHPGTYSFSIAAVDAAGNWNAAAGSFDITDTTPPTIQHVPLTEAVRNTPILVSAAISDVDAVLEARVDYTDVLGVRSNLSMTFTGSLYELTIPGQPQLGTLTYFIWTTDPSGNAVRTPSYAVTVVGADTTPPSIANVAASPPIQNAGGVVNITATVSDNIALGSVRVRISDPQGAALGNFSLVRLGATDTYYYEQAFVALGSYSFILWATDSAGNAASGAGSFQIVDTIAPVFQWVSVDPSTTEAGQSVNITASVTDNLAVSSVRIQIRAENGTLLLDRALTGASGLYWTDAVLRSLGNFTYTLEARDAVGNAASSQGTITVVDTQPPVAVAGPDVEVWKGSTVTFNASGSSDNSAIVSATWAFSYNGTDIVLSGQMASFRFVVPGQYSVTLTVTDAAGLQATAVLTVSVIADTTAPPTPQGVQVVPVGGSCLEITWEPSGSAETAGYQVYRWNATAASFELIAELPKEATAYTDCGLQNDTAYSYWVVAVDASGNPSPPSAIAYGRTSVSVGSPEDYGALYQAVLASILVLVVIVAAFRAGRKKGGASPPLAPRMR